MLYVSGGQEKKLPSENLHIGRATRFFQCIEDLEDNSENCSFAVSVGEPPVRGYHERMLVKVFSPNPLQVV
jgi:hypothetical protein